MLGDDTFGLNQSRTFVMPTPGGQRTEVTSSREWAGQGTEVEDVVCGSNPLIAVANPILNMIYQVRTLVHNPDPEKLRNLLIEDIKRFEARAKNENLPQDHVLAARYCLCTVLDETAAQTPWGGGGVWARYSLLVTFHNETWGGEKFFQILSKVTQSPAMHIDLIELMFYCISLGFQGRYKVVANGQSELDTLRRRLAEIILDVKGERVSAFSLNWRGVDKERLPMWSALPVWVSAIVCIVLAVVLYSVLSMRLSKASDSTFTNVMSTSLPEFSTKKPIINTSVEITRFLQPEINAGLVRVVELPNVTTVTLVGDGLFQSGSVELSPKYTAVVHKVAQAVDDYGRSVKVSGHTDDRPIRSVRFPSNWHLSLERARSVAKFLQSYLVSSTITVETLGVGAAEPIATNETAEGRALNRRVDIAIFTSSPSY